MGVGHVALALGAARAAPRLNVGWLVFAALVSDFLLGIFGFLGLEHATVPDDYAHRHYLLFCVPIVMCLLAATWNHQPTLRVPWGLTACFLVFNVTMFVAYLPDLENIMKDRCAALFATLPLWLIPVWVLWHRPAVASVEVEKSLASRAA